MKFTEITVEWSQQTFLFYLSIILVCYLLTVYLKKRNISWGGGLKMPAGLFVVALILLFVKGFSTTGRDLRVGYAANFESATSIQRYRDPTIEFGFMLLQIITKVLTDRYEVFIFVVGLITVLPVIYMINKYKNKIDVPAAVLLFLCVYFFNGFSSLRQYMAVSISLLAFDAIAEKRTMKALFWISAASLFHVTCLVLMIPYFFMLFRRMSKKMIAFSAAVMFVVFYFGRSSFIALVVGSNERYKNYTMSESVQFGMEVFIYFIPLFVLLFVCRRLDHDKYFSKLTYVYLVLGFLFGMMKYILSIFGRFQPVFMPGVIICVPYYVRLYKEHHRKNRRFLLNVVTVLYGLARFIIWITQYYILEDLMPYTNIFGNVI
ncbi:MAG: EpsG family protein [Anaerolineaceae bacterium]|nr:EpsG family protein [Anaerolineaceae bacterium]